MAIRIDEGDTIDISPMPNNNFRRFIICPHKD